MSYRLWTLGLAIVAGLAADHIQDRHLAQAVWNLDSAQPFPQSAVEGSAKDRTMGEKRSKQQVYTLVVQVGRKAGDGLPDGATGAGLVCYASGVDEAEAVRETVAILKQADLAPLDVTGYGTEAERRADGQEIDPEEQALMARALAENSVIVAQMTPFFGDEDEA